MNETEKLFYDVLMPVQSNITVIATSTTSGQTAIPAAWAGSFVTFEADGVDCYMAIGANPTADPTATGVGAGNVCVKLPADQPRTFFFPRGDSTNTTIALIAASGTPKVRAYRSSPTVQGA